MFSQAKVGGVLLLDPSASEEASQEGSALMALMPSSNQVTQLVMQGMWSDEDTKEALELCMGACVQLQGVVRESLLATC